MLNSKRVVEYYRRLIAGDKGWINNFFDELLINTKLRDADIERALEIMTINGSLPQTIDMIKCEAERSEVYSRLLEIIDLTIMRDILRLLKKYPSKYELDPEEAQAVIQMIAYNSPYLASINTISKLLGISWKKVDLTIKLGSLAEIIGIANNYAKSPEIRERKRTKKILR